MAQRMDNFWVFILCCVLLMVIDNIIMIAVPNFKMYGLFILRCIQASLAIVGLWYIGKLLSCMQKNRSHFQKDHKS